MDRKDIINKELPKEDEQDFQKHIQGQNKYITQMSELLGEMGVDHTFEFIHDCQELAQKKGRTFLTNEHIFFYQQARLYARINELPGKRYLKSIGHLILRKVRETKRSETLKIACLKLASDVFDDAGKLFELKILAEGIFELSGEEKSLLTEHVLQKHILKFKFDELPRNNLLRKIGETILADAEKYLESYDKHLIASFLMKAIDIFNEERESAEKQYLLAKYRFEYKIDKLSEEDPLKALGETILQDAEKERHRGKIRLDGIADCLNTASDVLDGEKTPQQLRDKAEEILPRSKLRTALLIFAGVALIALSALAIANTFGASIIGVGLGVSIIVAAASGTVGLGTFVGGLFSGRARPLRRAANKFADEKYERREQLHKGELVEQGRMGLN